MHATILDLRYRMNDVLKALRRSETIKVYYHGRQEGELIPTARTEKKHVKDHPLFGMLKHETLTVEQTLRKLRKPRYETL